MKTQAIYLHTPPLAERTKSPVLDFDTESVRRLLLPGLAALLPVVLVTILSIWAISIGALAYLSAAFWGAGFIFLALTLDADEGRAGILAASGLSLMALAWLSSYVAPEFGVLAGFLVSAWLSVIVVNRFGLASAGSS